MFKQLLVLLAAAYWLGGCATPLQVATDYDDTYSFKGKQTYALTLPDKMETIRNDLTRSRIEAALRQQLKDKGFTEAEKADADIWISYFGTAKEEQDYRTYTDYNMFWGYSACYRCYYPAGPAMSTTQVIHYTRGTLMIDFIDPATNKLKWRGTTSSKITTSEADNMSVDERKARINDAVTAILNRYPPAPADSSKAEQK